MVNIFVYLGFLLPLDYSASHIHFWYCCLLTLDYCAFSDKTGVRDVVPLEWLQMFDWKELQMLVSGASIPVDLTDLMENTRYGGMYILL